MRHRIWAACLLSIFVAYSMGCSRAGTSFPSKSITIVVPWDAGGGTDALARSLALESSDAFGVPINVLNRPGGSGTVGHSFGITARPDGYTVTMITFELCAYRALGRVPIGPENFRPIIQLNEDPAAITVHADSPWRTLGEFLDYARQHPNEITIGNSGPGAVWHIGALKLERAANASFTHIPHDGARPAVTQLLGKHLDAVSVSPAEALQYIQDGTLRCLAIMSEERFDQLPEVPTLSEYGIDVTHGTWRGLAVPLDTPDSIVDELAEGFTEGWRSQAFQASARTMLLGLRYRDSAAFEQFLRNESESANSLLAGIDFAQQTQGGVGAWFFPRFMGALLALSLLAVALIEWNTRDEKVATAPEEVRRILLVPLAATLMLIAYVALMFNIGYAIATLAYLIAMMAFLGERNPRRILIHAAVTVTLIVLVFQTLLDVPLPVFWGG